VVDAPGIGVDSAAQRPLPLGVVAVGQQLVGRLQRLPQRCLAQRRGLVKDIAVQHRIGPRHDCSQVRHALQQPFGVAQVGRGRPHRQHLLLLRGHVGRGPGLQGLQQPLPRLTD
jgi:hypothetical protein